MSHADGEKATSGDNSEPRAKSISRGSACAAADADCENFGLFDFESDLEDDLIFADLARFINVTPHLLDLEPGELLQ